HHEHRGVLPAARIASRWSGAAGPPVAPLGRSIGRPCSRRDDMELGAFSVSLAVKDVEASKAFYEKLGFAPFFGEASQGWLIMRNGSTVIGLFQRMFERNILTFNPGWDGQAQAL